ncbi:hypothetical protein ACFVIM_10530 [Streptomyces sp. NPDC057638]|uniref:hypothetical protein n=1 Tax=Streptomyces sp. NPDC057638 TaxID=3346190 RepID=UPI0036B5B891
MSRTGRDHALASRESVSARYRDGETLTALAREFGVSDAWLRQRLAAWGVPVRGVREARLLRGASAREDHDGCSVCRELAAAERAAALARDHSRATDCRVLIRRHLGRPPGSGPLSPSVGTP